MQSIDLAINEGINYTGLEALWQVEELEDYQRGLLPGWTAVPNCAADLHALDQQVIPVNKVECNLGEMYQYNYEKVVRYLLKTFLLYDIAQQESIEMCITLDGAELTKDLCHL